MGSTKSLLTIGIVVVGGIFLMKYIKQAGGINNIFKGIMGGDSGLAGDVPATGKDGKETNPPKLTAPAPASVVAQLQSGIAIPTLEIAPQYLQAMDFYAGRIAAEIDTHAVSNLSNADDLQIKGTVLLNNKADLLDIAYLNGLGATQDIGGITSTVLTPPALQKFAVVLLNTSRRMGITLKPHSLQLFQLYASTGNLLPTAGGAIVAAPSPVDYSTGTVGGIAVGVTGMGSLPYGIV
jgi:hypothetical protein